jgi:hypothetical protein
MWILFVISFIPEYNDYKVVEFNRYNTRQQCDINQAVLRATFEDNELTACAWQN